MVDGRLRRVKEPPDLALAQVARLVVPPDTPPLWVVYTGPFSGEYQLVAVYTRASDRWRELAWRELGYDEIAPTERHPEVTTVQITADRIWFVLDGFTGNHGSAWNLFSFDGRQLVLQVSVVNAAYNLGQIADVNGDGTPDVVLDVSNYYLLSGSADVAKISLQVWTWDPATERMMRKHLTLAPPAPTRDPAAELNDAAVRLAAAGLWKDARRLISQAMTAAAEQPALAVTVAWNEAIIHQHADAMLAAIAGTRRGGAAPEVAHLFYGDYAAVIDLWRRVPVDALFQPRGSPPAGSLLGFISREARGAVDAALAVQPELAPAHLVKGWLAYQRGDATTARAEVSLAAALAPTDDFYQAASARLSALDSH